MMEDKLYVVHYVHSLSLSLSLSLSHTHTLSLSFLSPSLATTQPTRGYGLFIGLEVVKDKSSKEPDGETCIDIVHG